MDRPASICIVTARGGSKRIPRKNLKHFLGRPIIEYSIEAALASKLFTHVMVSTDDEEIASTALAAGAEVPFFRSLENSDDFSSTADVLLEVLGEYSAQGMNFEFACCCYPTAVFTTADKLIRAHERLLAEDADCIFPVAPYSSPIQRAFSIETEGQLRFMWPENERVRSQDLPKAYYDVGQFYFFRVSKFLRFQSLMFGKTVPLTVSALEAQDIDDLSDWQLAEMKYLAMKENQ